MKKVLISVLFILFIVVSIIFSIFKEDVYSANLFYMDTYINVKVVTTKSKGEKALKDIENIFKKYENLTNRYSESELSKINNKVGTFEVSEELFDILKVSVDWYYKSDGLFNVNIGNIVDVWKRYRENKNGVPSLSELDQDISIENIKFEDNKVIVNNANIDLGAIVKGYVTNVIKEYLEENEIKNYIVNAGGNVLVGEKKDKFKVGIENPDGGILEVLNINNSCIVTSGGKERYYEYDGVKYHHIIDPVTKYPANHMKSVTVITDDCTKADILSTTLFLMPIEDGIKFIEDDVDVLWYSNDNKIIKSEGFNYE